MKNGRKGGQASGVAVALGYERPAKAIPDHVDEEDRKMVDGKTQSQFGIELGQRGGWLINESGLYSLILSSKLPTAKKFKRWVTAEVLSCWYELEGAGADQSKRERSVKKWCLLPWWEVKKFLLPDPIEQRTNKEKCVFHTSWAATYDCHNL